MKNILLKKILLPSYIFAFCISFMLFFYEPLTLYANNINDLWFDIYIIFPVILLMFITSFIVISLIFSILYSLSNKLFKKINIYNIFLISSFILFIYLYIQGNYLIGDLPPLDGSKIEWTKYLKKDIISLVIIFILVIIQIILLKKFKIKKYINIVKYVSLAVVGMLSVSLLTTILTTDFFLKKETPYVLTEKNINKVSTDSNFFIFLVDAVDSVMFYDATTDSSKYNDLFRDFTYFPDVVGAYPFTRDSIPFILSGEWNNNKDNFNKYSTKTLNNSKLLKELKSKEYNINLYTNDLILNGKKTNISNAYKLSRKVRIIKFFKQEVKYILFKYLPYSLKKYSKIETLDFNFTKVKDDLNVYNNIYSYNILKNKKIEKIEEKYFSFWHVEGGHVPFNYDEDLNIIEDGTYEQKLLATAKVIEAYLNRLKENDVYDNSVIIIMSDHGYSFTGHIGRQNPILFIKGLNEEHELNISDKPISFGDLNDAYMDLLDGKTSEELFEDIDEDRERRFILYEYTKEDKMYEYIQKGKAWDEDTLIPTGKEYILK